MKSSLPATFEKLYHSRKESNWRINIRRLGLLLFWSLGLSSLFIFFLLYSANPFRVCRVRSSVQELHQSIISAIRPKDNKGSSEEEEDEEYCELFKGRWIEDPKGPVYTNWSCRTMPEHNNCRKYGREDVDFVKWRWKPDDCELPRFDPKTFFTIFQGKKLGFIGDSLARNHMDSLLCLLSHEETPTEIYRDSEDRFGTWYFPSHDFTLMVFWSRFLVVAEEILINGSVPTGGFNIHLDRIDQTWASKLPELDYAIISDGHWFSRKHYIHEGDKLIGCIFCNEANVTDHGLGFPLRRVFRNVLQYINDCNNCSKGLVTLVRTFSPAHFEGGPWNNGGYCNRTSPSSDEEANLESSSEWELRSIQVKEIERAREEGKKRGNKFFGALDVTRAMWVRADGHPGTHYNSKWTKGFNDCLHWCLPGPIDAWNDLLMAVLRKENGGLFLS